MTPASWPRDEPLAERMLVIDRDAGAWSDAHVGDLAQWLSPRDVLVVNDAATLPASFACATATGAAVELRLAGHLDGDRWRAVLFGQGDWHTRTEDRPAPPPLAAGAKLRIAPELGLTLESVDSRTPRLVVVRFFLQGAALWSALYRWGRPIQYAHAARALELWHVQTPFASRPWAVEMPSAGRPLTWALVDKLQSRGVRVARLTHAAGLSATGDRILDAELPLPERFEIPVATSDAIALARRGW